MWKRAQEANCFSLRISHFPYEFSPSDYVDADKIHFLLGSFLLFYRKRIPVNQPGIHGVRAQITNPHVVGEGKIVREKGTGSFSSDAVVHGLTNMFLTSRRSKDKVYRTCV